MTATQGRPQTRTMFVLLAAILSIMAMSASLAVAAAPLAQTAAASNVAATTTTLNGTVLPGQNDTMYFFEYGTTTAYGTPTPTQGPISGNAGKSVSADVTGLAPSTTYHFRLVAMNSAGTSPGADMTFTTTASGPPVTPPPAQNAVTIAPAAASVTFGRTVTFTGQLSGPNNAGVEVMLEENPYPYTGNFKNTAVKTTTTATGGYSLSVTPAVNTHYRVTAKTKGPVTSGEAAVNVRLKVSFRMSDLTPAKGQRVLFSGVVAPGHDGKVARIQRRTSTGSWRTVASATLVATTPLNGVARSKYSKRIRVTRTGTYRVKVSPGDGDHIAGTSSRHTARVH